MSVKRDKVTGSWGRIKAVQMTRYTRRVLGRVSRQMVNLQTAVAYLKFGTDTQKVPPHLAFAGSGRSNKERDRVKARGMAGEESGPEFGGAVTLFDIPASYSPHGTVKKLTRNRSWTYFGFPESQRILSEIPRDVVPAVLCGGKVWVEGEATCENTAETSMFTMRISDESKKRERKKQE
ncbi:hypothetical protein B0H19DRAFT_1073796 [Mycena capillaripes]|nr:hypothetical protein B0H19DRAFT_1073796 [Mycena capillaripes]